MEVGCQRHGPAALLPGKRLILQGDGWVWMGAGFDSRTVLPVANRYTYYAILTHLTWVMLCEKM